MSEHDKAVYQKLKADPVRYALYLKRKSRERKARPEYQKARKRAWRNNNPEGAKKLRQANHAVEYAVKKGELIRPATCSNCDSGGRIEAHHHLGYAQEHWLDVVWLCQPCHREADSVDPESRKRIARECVAKILEAEDEA